MKKSEYFVKSLINAAGAFAYIAAVAWLLFNGEKIFGKAQNFAIPIFLLLLLVISATVTALLVLGKPASLYWSGLKKEGIVLLLCTLAWLVVFALSVVIIVLI